MQQVIIHSCGNPRAEFGCRYIRGAQWATVLTIGAGDDDNEGDDNDDGTVHALGGFSIHMYVCKCAGAEFATKSAGTLCGRRDLLQEMFDWSFTCLGAGVLSGIRRDVAVAYAQGINMHATACAAWKESISF